MSIDSPGVTEGTPGPAAALRFPVTLSAASGRQVTVDYADAGTGTATADTGGVRIGGLGIHRTRDPAVAPARRDSGVAIN